MNTPAHLIFGAGAFARPGARWVTAAALLGGLLPDLSLYILGSWALYIQQIPPQTVFNELYFSPSWQRIFAIDNSIPLWGAICGLGLALRRPALVALGGAALLHVLLDLPLHHDDGRPHFWPFSDWVFESPISYWDSAQFAWIVAPIEGLACVALVVLLWRRFESWLLRLLFAALLFAELWVIRQWLVFF